MYVDNNNEFCCGVRNIREFFINDLCIRFDSSGGKLTCPILNSVLNGFVSYPTFPKMEKGSFCFM